MNQIKTENKVSDKLEPDIESDFVKMSWISLPVYEGFNQFAIWPSQQSVSKARLKMIMLVFCPLKLLRKY